MRLAFVDLKKRGFPVDVTRSKCLLPVNSLHRCNSHLYREQIDFPERASRDVGRSRRGIEKLMRAKMNIADEDPVIVAVKKKYLEILIYFAIRA